MTWDLVYFVDLMTMLKAHGNKRQKIKDTQKIKDSIGLQKIEKRD